jgi:DNA-binding NarL/FixJ family response regulator
MPRPKPPAPLVVRSVRMTEAYWQLFDRLGGAEWLRGQMRTHEMRRRNVLKLLAAKTPHREIAQQLGISTKTIQNVWKGLL